MFHSQKKTRRILGLFVRSTVRNRFKYIEETSKIHHLNRNDTKISFRSNYWRKIRYVVHTKEQMAQQCRHQDIEFTFFSALHFKCDLRFPPLFSVLLFSAFTWKFMLREKTFSFLYMLLTHPLTHMGRVSMLAAHFCALLLTSCRACLHCV